MGYFNLDSGVLQQYGRPPTPEVTSDPFGSAVAGFQVGQNISLKRDANNRAEEELQLRKQDSADAKLSRERDQVRQEARDAQLKKKEDAATQLADKNAKDARRRLDAELEAKKAQTAGYKQQTSRQKFLMQGEQQQKGAKDAVVSVIAEVEAANKGNSMTREESDAAVYEKLITEHAGEMDSATLKEWREKAYAGTSSVTSRDRQMEATKSMIILSDSENIDAAVEAMNSEIPEGQPVVVGITNVPPDDTPEGSMGFKLLHFDGRDDVKLSVSTATRADESFASTRRQSTNLAINRDKTARMKLENEYKAALTNFTVENTRNDADATLYNKPLTKDEISEGSVVLAGFAGDFLDSFPPEQQDGIVDEVLRNSRVLVQRARGKLTKDQALMEAVELIKDAQYKASTGKERPRYSAFREFFGKDYADAIPASADPKDRSEAFTPPEGTVPEKKPPTPELREAVDSTVTTMVTGHDWSKRDKFTTPADTSRALRDLQDSVYTYLKDQGYSEKEIEASMQAQGILN